MSRAYKCDKCGEFEDADENPSFNVSRSNSRMWEVGDFCPGCFEEGVTRDHLNKEDLNNE